eukprot:TRINITY_DN3022_c0_g1_i1.p1 TRINITY_DN3022_c0_g1~~TRINITY_DN3022_c0_g1_i1.p1  ORF type:complete len:180 (-),score=38.40 TRINITY_DN3022_c0_g1_i1:313-852(-)
MRGQTQDTKSAFQRQLKQVAEENYLKQSQQLGYVIIARCILILLTIWPYVLWQGKDGVTLVLVVMGLGSLCTLGVEIFGAFAIWRASSPLFVIYYYIEYLPVFMYETVVFTSAIYGIVICRVDSGDDRDATCSPSYANIVVLIRYFLTTAILVFGRRFGLPLKRNLQNLSIGSEDGIDL